MTGTVLQIVKPPVDDEVVALLEEALEDARQGKVRAVAMAIVTNDLQIGSTWSTGDSFAALLGAIASLQHDFITAPNE